jgi:hypothetical protein
MALLGIDRIEKTSLQKVAKNLQNKNPGFRLGEQPFNPVKHPFYWAG